MPAVKRMGKIRISQMDVPRAAWMELIPRRATSDEVSKPRPKRTPSGYIFQGRSMRENVLRRRRVMQPAPWKLKSSRVDWEEDAMAFWRSW